MAILKHLAVHNRFYQDAVTYFLFRHDNHARPIYNAQHKKILRENVLIDAINTEVWSYSTDCQIANQRSGKNRDEKEVKSHHIIISFPKEDRDKHGLTMELAQEMGMEFARKHFGGHQCVVATHDEGNNHSGTIHLHIGRIIDLNDPKIQASYGLTQWAKIQNLKTMSMSFNYLTENNLLNMDKLQDTIEAERTDFNRDTQELLTVEKKQQTCNMLLKNLGIYHKFRPIHQQYIQSRKSAKFKEQHMRELLLYDGAVKKLHEYQERHNRTTVPNMKDLQYWKSQLVPQQAELYERRRREKQEIKTMEDGYDLLKRLEHQVQRQPNLHRYNQLE